MRIRLRYLLVAAAAAALCNSPVAAADNGDQTCNSAGGATECSSPGNVQITDDPSAGEFTLPYWDEAFGGAYPGPYPVPYDEGSGDLGRR